MLEFWIRYRKYTRLLLVLLASVALLLTHAQTRREGRWLAEGIAAVTAPIQAAFARVHRGATGLWTTYLEWKALRADAERLRAEVAALRLRQLRQDELEAENVRFRALLALRERLPIQTIGAEVVAREWNGFTRALTVNRGRADGLERLGPVIVISGVVGRVMELRRGSAVIQLLTDPASSIGGVVHRTRAQGLVEGVAGGRMRLKLPAREEGVAVGDLVFTSGIGGVFPKGLPLGRVTRVHPATGLFRIAEVEPAVDLATVEEVLVLPRGAPGDLGGAFFPGA
ncbi:MAG: rod shape-determining protein MreC [Candidatus Rokubacteria bacterium]|nr:rod shape-determining protein MreC [Candidatus Rokubacteria bacterium]